MLADGTHDGADADRDPAALAAPVDSEEASGAAGALRVQRALAELRGGRPVVLGRPGGAGSSGEVEDGTDAARLLAMETLGPSDLDAFTDAEGRVHGWLAAGRARAAGLVPGPGPDVGVVAFALEARALGARATVATLHAIAGLAPSYPGSEPSPEAVRDAAPDAASTRPHAARGPLPAAALALARRSSLLPALLQAHAARDGSDRASAVEPVGVDDVAAYPEACGRLIERASSAHVPLAGAGRCEFAVYRERFGEAEHVAVTVGEPDLARPVTVRIHSACFTGDIFGSMKCDCGEQLRGAVARLAADGGGVILYLAQEGRGIGLANKLRAYALQERGLDTIDADRELGFGPDGRDFTVARTMLADLGIARVRLVTNNPRKIAALEAGGIEVVDRVPSVASINPHNAHYLETKRDRAGHLIADGLVAVGE